MSEERRLAAIMFTDMVGYTALMGRDEARARELVEHARSLLKSFVKKYHGQWLEEIGDGTLSAFPSAVEAVDCALAIQDALQDDPELSLRIGIHLGDVMFAEGRVYGDGVNVASRLEPLARPRGIVASEAVCSAIRGHPRARLSYLGKKRLKNVDQPVRVYALAHAEQTGAIVEGFLKGLWARRVPHVLVLYGLLVWGLYQGTRWLVERYALAPQWPELCLVVLIALTPALVLVSYHQATREGRKLGPIERVGVPLNLLAALLLVVVFLRVAPITPVRAGPASVAVLPFVNMSGDVDDQYFGDGLADELITTLAGLKDVKVVARTSSFAFRDHAQNPKEIAEQLKVKYLLTGSVLRIDNEVRISIRLIDARDGNLIWADRYVRPMTEILAIQSEVARMVGSEILGSIQPIKGTSLLEYREVSPKAYDAYIKARYYWDTQFGLANFDHVRQLIDQSIALDDTYAPAHALKATVYAILSTVRDHRLMLPKAKAASERALALDPMIAEAHAARAFVATQQWRWKEAEDSFRKAIKLNPNSVVAHQWYMQYLRQMRRTNEALAAIKRAHELNPTSLTIKTQIGWVHADMKNYDTAIREWQSVVNTNPDFGLAVYNLGLVYMIQGDYQEAIRAFQKSMPLLGGWLPRARLGAAYGYAGQHQAARGILREMERLHRDGQEVRASAIAYIYLALGELERTFEWLNRAYELREPRLPGMMSEPLFDSIRDHPQFIALREKTGLGDVDS